MEESGGAAVPAVKMENSHNDGAAVPATKREANNNDGPAQQDRPSKRQKHEKGGHRKNKHQPGHYRDQKKSYDVTGERATGPKGDALWDLKRGLQFVTASAATASFPENVLQHARELYQALFDVSSNAGVKNEDVAPVSPPASSSQLNAEPEEEAAKNKHTDLPPPFPLPDPATFMKGPSPALLKLNQTAPSSSNFAPIPPMVNSSFTNLVAAPSSTMLPPLPPITDVLLFNAPFTHTSALASYVPPTNTNTYEPLEFLGDAYLEVISTRLIHARFPMHTVGQKAGLREILVKNETLAEYSAAYGFSERIRSTPSSRQGPSWSKVLADVFEAYLACVVIQDGTEQGFVIAEKWLTELWAPKILEWRRNGDGLRDANSSKSQQLDAKSDLNRLLVGKESKLEYKEEKPMALLKEGNRTVFYIGVYLTGWGFDNQHLGSGEGRSKQIAGTVAATNALQQSQDIIQLANQRKIHHERNFRKKAGVAALKQNFGRGQ